MDSILKALSDFTLNLVNYSGLIAVIVGVLANLLSIGILGWSRKLASAGLSKMGFVVKDLPVQRDGNNGEPKPQEAERSHAERRLGEAKLEVERQDGIAWRNQLASSLLTFGQYIIGGALASSFIQDSLSKPIIGTLGVLVLLSSLIHQRYRPDIKVRGAKERIYKLRSLIRETEDALVAFHAHPANAVPLEVIIRSLTSGLNETIALENRDIDALAVEIKTLPSARVQPK